MPKISATPRAAGRAIIRFGDEVTTWTTRRLTSVEILEIQADTRGYADALNASLLAQADALPELVELMEELDQLKQNLDNLEEGAPDLDKIKATRRHIKTLRTRESMEFRPAPEHVEAIYAALYSVIHDIEGFSNEDDTAIVWRDADEVTCLQLLNTISHQTAWDLIQAAIEAVSFGEVEKKKSSPTSPTSPTPAAAPSVRDV